MHRMRLDLLTLPSSWDRNLPEYELFEKTLLCGNIVEMDFFLEVLTVETDRFFTNCTEIHAERMGHANVLINSGDPDNIKEALNILEMVIYRAPTETIDYTDALMARGTYYMQQGHISLAVNDFNMYIYHGLGSKLVLGLFRVHGLLAICYYMMQNYDKSRENLDKCNTFKDKIQLTNNQNESIKKCVRMILEQIPKLEHELSQEQPLRSSWNGTKQNYVPYQGFNKNNEIPLCSSACSYVTKTLSSNGASGIYAHEIIPKGEIVIVEDPILYNFSTPFAHCECCFAQQSQLYTCSKCRYKTYCSMDCMQKDKAEHDDECLGYKYLILLILDATKVFRLFMRVVKHLSERISKSPIELYKLSSVANIWHYLINLINENSRISPYLRFMTKRPNYEELTPSQFTTLMTYTFRLTMFVFRKTNVRSMLFDKLTGSMKTTLVMIGAILMRLNCHIMLNSKESEFNVAFSREIYVESKEHAENVEAAEARSFFITRSNCAKQNIFQYYKIDCSAENAAINARIQSKINTTDKPVSLPIPKHSIECPRIFNSLTNFMDNIVQMTLDPESLNFFLFGEACDNGITPTAAKNLGSLVTFSSNKKRCELLTKFSENFHKHVDEYFVRLRSSRNYIRQVVTSLCTTLTKFRHSCNANVEIIQLNNGVILGKTLMDININEELTVSYKADYMHHNRSQREAYLKQNGIVCKRACCTMPEENEPTNIRLGIYCEECNEKHRSKIHPVPGKCSNCNTNFQQQLLNYRMYISCVEEEIRRKEKSGGDVRALSILHATYFQYVNLNFVESNELRIRVELNFATFLANKEFLQQACDVIYDVRKHLNYYNENSLWLHFYANILQIIKIILTNAIDKSQNVLEASDLNKLITLGFYILNGHEKYINFYHGGDRMLLPVLKDLQKFNEWKEKIDSFILMPAIIKQSLLEVEGDDLN